MLDKLTIAEPQSLAASWQSLLRELRAGWWRFGWEAVIFALFLRRFEAVFDRIARMLAGFKAGQQQLAEGIVACEAAREKIARETTAAGTTRIEAGLPNPRNGARGTTTPMISDSSSTLRRPQGRRNPSTAKRALDAIHGSRRFARDDATGSAVQRLGLIDFSRHAAPWKRALNVPVNHQIADFP